MRTGSRPCCQPGAQSSILKECLQFRCSGSGGFCGEGLIPGPETSLAKKKKKGLFAVQLCTLLIFSTCCGLGF